VTDPTPVAVDDEVRIIQLSLLTAVHVVVAVGAFTTTLPLAPFF
jgi:hypothetical protein